jgi:hypothetical protein
LSSVKQVNKAAAIKFGKEVLSGLWFPADS